MPVLEHMHFVYIQAVGIKFQTQSLGMQTIELNRGAKFCCQLRVNMQVGKG